MVRPLVISKDFCISENPAGMIERDFWNNLPADYSPMIICSSLNADIKISRDVIAIREIIGTRILQGLLNRFPIPDFHFLPDCDYFSWGWKAKKKIISSLKCEKFDYIDSLGMPHSSHLLALKLKRITGLPWIARFYDPWIDNQFLKYKFNHFRLLNESMEYSVAENADVIIHNNEHIADVWRNRYGAAVAKKIIVIPMVFNWEKMPKNNSHTHINGTLVISHIGNLFGVRTAHYLILGINNFISKHPDVRGKIIVNLVGLIPGEDMNDIKRLNLEDVFKTPGRIPENECYKFFEESDLFVSIDGEGSLDLNYPSKLLKYYYFGKPILGLTIENSVAAEELDRSGNYHVLNTDVQSISDFIEKAFYNYQSIDDIDRYYYLNYSKEKVINRYDHTVKSLLYI